MARPMKPFPEPVRATVDHYRQPTSGAGSVALSMDAEAKRSKLTRAQRDKLPPVIKAMLGLRDGPGRPGGWGPSPYKMDGFLVERVIRLLVEESDLKIQTATERVWWALHDDPSFDALQWLENGWFTNVAETDVERIAGKVRVALVGDQQFANAEERQRLIDAELAHLRRIWAQVQSVKGSD